MCTLQYWFTEILMFIISNLNSTFEGNDTHYKTNRSIINLYYNNIIDCLIN